MRTALYVSCSTAKQEHSPATQLHELHDYARRRGFTVAHEYIDEGISGARDSRPALDRMLVDSRRGRFDLVLVVRLDRLGRNLRHLLVTLEELSSHGVAFASATEPIDTSTPAGRMVIAVLGAAAEFERGLLRERTRAGLASARRRGQKLGRPRVVVDVLEAERLASAGFSRRAIARRLGVSPATVHRVLAGCFKNAPAGASHDGNDFAAFADVES